MRPILSILLPVRDGVGTLGRAIHNMLGQTFRDFELLILDDGSEDASLNVARRLSRSDKRIIPVPLPRRGIVNALNTGLDLARGDFIARMDADDMSHPLRMGMQVNYLLNHPRVGLVSCLVDFGGDRRKAAGYARHVDILNSLVSHADMALHRFRESPVAHPSVMFRRETVRDHGTYTAGPFPEDYELWLRWFEAGVRFAKVRRRLLIWNDPCDRLSRTNPRYTMERFHEVKSGFLARHLAKVNPYHPEIILIGAGRESRKRANMLLKHGVVITAYVDVDPRKVGMIIHGRPVLHRNELSEPGSCFGVSFLAGHGSAEELAECLENRGWVMGKHFLLAA